MLICQVQNEHAANLLTPTLLVVSINANLARSLNVLHAIVMRYGQVETILIVSILRRDTRAHNSAFICTYTNIKRHNLLKGYCEVGFYGIYSIIWMQNNVLLWMGAARVLASNRQLNILAITSCLPETEAITNLCSLQSHQIPLIKTVILPCTISSQPLMCYL